MPLNDGRVVFSGNVNTNDGAAGGQAGVWQIGPGGPTPLARVSTVLNGLGPNLPDGSTFSSFEQLITTRTGEVLVDGRLQNPGGAALVRLSSIDPNTALARTDTDSTFGPQLGTGISFFRFNQTRSTGGFIYATTADLQGTGVDDSNAEGVFKVSAKLTGDRIVPVARGGTDGALGPNMGAGVMFAPPPPAPNGSPVFANVTGHDETLAFSGRISGGGFTPADNNGLWIGDENGLTAIAITNVSGEFGPELPDASFVFKSFGNLAMNDDETFFFSATTAALAAPTGQNGLWAYVDGDTLPVVMVGDAIVPDPLNPLVLKTVSSVGTDWNADPVTARVALTLTFTDGSRGVFTAPVPEPASVIAGGGLLAGLALRRRQTRRR